MPAAPYPVEKCCIESGLIDLFVFGLNVAFSF